MKPVVILSVLIFSVLALAGCRGIPTPGERQARHELRAVANQYQPGNEHPPLPLLTPDSSLSNYLAFALLNSPTVKAAFYDWSASVENITVSRSRPDPQLTLQAYITDTLTSLMPGLTWNFPGPGKLTARARIATAASQGKYFAFQSAVFQAAFDLEKAYYGLGLLQEQLRLKQAMLALLENSDRAARAQNNTGAGTLATVYQLQGDRERLKTELAGLADSRNSLRENFKAALGLSPQEAAPPIPDHFETSDDKFDTESLLRQAFAHNPQLAAMAAEIRGAEAGIVAAYKDRVPDFNAGMSVEAYAPPFFWPQAGMTLPLWRDKLAAELAQAIAADLASKQRLQAAQISLAVGFAEKAFALRETGRSLDLLEHKLLPLARASRETVRAGYRVGTGDFSRLIEAERAPLDLELAAAQAQADHEIALAELSLLIAGVPPSGTPILSNLP